MKSVKYYLIVLVLSSCGLDDLIFEYPEDIVSGEYEYSSTSVYYNFKDVVQSQSRNDGFMDISVSGSNGNLQVYPRLGWSYSININAIVSYTLADNSEAQSFNISRQSESIDGDEFQLNGTGNTQLTNTNGAVIGTFDGTTLNNGNTIEFEIESVNVENGDYVITTILATPDN